MLAAKHGGLGQVDGLPQLSPPSWLPLSPEALAWADGSVRVVKIHQPSCVSSQSSQEGSSGSGTQQCSVQCSLLYEAAGRVWVVDSLGGKVALP